MNENQKYEVIKELVDHPNANKNRAALTLGCTRRTINRMIAGYKDQGKEFFVHGNKGRKPTTAIPENTRKTIVDLYQTKYYNSNFTHFTELLDSIEGISISTSTVASILESENILSPKATRAKKKRVKKELEAKKKSAKTKKEADKIQSNIIALEDSHPRHPRRAYRGELEQMDASSFVWFGTEETYLHVAIDDATGEVTGAWFDKEETLNGYYHVLQQMLTNYGIPYEIFTDRRTVFTYKKKESPSLDEDTYTQFAYACKQLGIVMESSSVPEAKGRIERLNQTLQSRLPVELRLAGITTMDEANEFLRSYLKKFNAKFALPIDHIKSVFVEQPSDEKINLILAVISERTVDSGHCIQYNHHYYRMVNAQGTQVCYLKGTKVMVIKAFDESLYCNADDKEVLALEEIPEHEEKSKDLDPDYEAPKSREKYIPPMSHPWRKTSFNKFTSNQEHHWNDQRPISV